MAIAEAITWTLLTTGLILRAAAARSTDLCAGCVRERRLRGETRDDAHEAGRGKHARADRYDPAG